MADRRFVTLEAVVTHVVRAVVTPVGCHGSKVVTARAVSVGGVCETEAVRYDLLYLVHEYGARQVRDPRVGV